MKQLNKVSIAVLLALSTSSIYADDSLLDKVQFNKSDSVLSDQIYYQIGGGSGYMTPPTRAKSLKAIEFGIGWKANLMCGNFDIKTTVKNQLNGLTEGFKDLMGNVIESAKGAVASLPAMVIQRANPQLYDLLTNGVYQGRIDFNRLKTSCEAMSKQLADYTLNGRWAKSADLENYKDIVATEPDAQKAQKSSEENKGKKGKEWVGGEKRGGEYQKQIKLIEDVSKAGYNLLQNRQALDASQLTGKACTGALCQTFDSPQKLSEFLTRIIGEQSISTCTADCGPQTSSRAGTGLGPAIEEENIQTIEKLEQVLNMDTPSKEILAELSSNTIPVTRGLIEALREDPDVEVLSQRLSAEIATAKVMEKMLLARRAILAGMREPYVAADQNAQQELEKALNKIDLEISQVKLEMDMQKMITSNTASVVIQNKLNRETNVGNHGESYDNVDKRVNDLAYGTPNAEDHMEAGDISLPRRNIALDIPTVSNVAPYRPTYNTGSKAGIYSGSYNPIAPINGSSLDQATSLLRKFEGFIGKAKWDMNAQRLGYGSDTITKADGTVIKVQPGMTVTREDAERDLARRTKEFANIARRNVSAETWDKLPPNAQAVLTSMAYNYGSLSKLESVVKAANVSANTGDMTALANAIRRRQVDNGGMNARRRNQEADYVLNKTN
ncbi:TPA: integrating conjugative element protein [Pasteurella multocida]|uniref:integrating conjugative element protein n=1 Tax=Pasteurella multocida TaxID=747 RepID=UPI0007F91DCD|nr:integrating conjugative element protein [Pasteurella multocida]OBP21283.1 integrating conjugative element protein, PFL_4711 family [Pasteurella multocida subsp. multocida]UWZ95067.1 integrating conjugative element protein [Pasteurella multocida subsp. multocida]HDX1017792.1 integrating conjugative element protein [Pasteurella multocida]HDX1018608.1 integrating conjugative element protein [Pasteurella multocida]HDX1097000.1 integrating conjugative element protein [Pasteurella multocida]